MSEHPPYPPPPGQNPYGQNPYGGYAYAAPVPTYDYATWGCASAPP